jgi:hypothetical protein
MRKILTLSLAATTAISAVAFSTAASAYDYGSYRNYYSSNHNSDVAGAAIAAGVIGLVIGAALASSSSHNYDNGYYNRGYSQQPYYGGSYGYSQPYYGGGYGSYGGGYGYGQQPYYGGGYGYQQRCYTTRSWDPYYGGYTSRRVCR